MLGLGAGTDDISGSSGAGEANARHLGMDRQGVAHNRTLSDNQGDKGDLRVFKALHKRAGDCRRRGGRVPDHGTACRQTGGQIVHGGRTQGEIPGGDNAKHALWFAQDHAQPLPLPAGNDLRGHPLDLVAALPERACAAADLAHCLRVNFPVLLDQQLRQLVFPGQNRIGNSIEHLRPRKDGHGVQLLQLLHGPLNRRVNVGGGTHAQLSQDLAVDGADNVLISAGPLAPRAVDIHFEYHCPLSFFESGKTSLY